MLTVYKRLCINTELGLERLGEISKMDSVLLVSTKSGAIDILVGGAISSDKAEAAVAAAVLSCRPGTHGSLASITAEPSFLVTAGLASDGSEEAATALSG